MKIRFDIDLFHGDFNMQKKQINSPNREEEELKESCGCGCSEDLSEKKEKQNISHEEELEDSCCSEDSHMTMKKSMIPVKWRVQLVHVNVAVKS